MNLQADEEYEVKEITKIVYFCGKCNKIIGHDFFCKPCQIQYPKGEFDDE